MLVISMFFVFIILIISGVAALTRNSERARVEQRFPLQGLGYCTSNDVRPCVVSFGSDDKGNMLVNLLTNGAFYPDFYLRIKTDEKEYIYVCEKTSRFATSVHCTGQKLPVGKEYQFLLLSVPEEVLLAQGTFPIIGMAIATPAFYASATPTGTLAATSTPVDPSYPNAAP